MGELARYQDLESLWTEDQRSFAQWLAKPQTQRIPNTASEFAKLIGIHAVVLSKWKTLPGFMAYVRYLMYQSAIEAFPDVWGTIIRKAVAGDIQYSKLFLSMIGESEIVAGSNAREVQHTMTDDEAIKIMERAGVRVERARLVGGGATFT